MAGDPVIADSNHDGNLDIILACGTCCSSPPDPLSGHVQVLLGDGRGGFRPAQGSSIPVGSSARKVAVGDANSDGHPVIIIAQHESYEVVALLGDGRGGFKPAPGSPFVAASGPHVHQRAHTHAITTSDVNGDGNLDLLTTNAQVGYTRCDVAADHGNRQSIRPAARSLYQGFSNSIPPLPPRCGALNLAARFNARNWRKSNVPSRQRRLNHHVRRFNSPFNRR